MEIAVIGLGYVGCIAIAKLAENGFNVIGIDKNKNKVDQINRGKATVIEPGLDDLIATLKAKNRISAKETLSEIPKKIDVFYICVGTPENKNGDLNLNFIFNVLQEIKENISADVFKVIVIRSTVRPYTHQKIEELFEGYKVGIVINPEFLREGCGLADWDNQETIVLGSNNKAALKIVSSLYKNVNARIFKVEPQVAEFIKYINNSWHALKVTFANEIARIANSQKINIEQLTEVFLADKKLNISEKYLLPGMPYGGSCLSKDLKALNHLAGVGNIKTSLLASVSKSNKEHIEYIIEKIEASGKKKIGFIGLSFKEGTDDLRYSPSLEILKKLRRKKLSLFLFDENIVKTLRQKFHNNHILSKEKWVKDITVSNVEVLAQSCEVVVLFHRYLDEKKIKTLFTNHIIIHAYKLR